MFTRFFSCFNDSTENRHVDLSNPAQGSQFKPQMHPESNINGKNINFEMEDGRVSSLQLNFLSS